ncbi:ABC transporter substrate-binding protein [uncultured Azonexus sp.]|uniref:ABC transporter substrate-binding protein n=1 Tax=uncultured Azonexus sp. TaxID=520307 RepID=UPI00262CC201|nr:ABC transporter substrate-binding protein [uncultured Azonexus sp.]
MSAKLQKILAIIGLLLLSACGNQEPIRIGLLAGLSDRGSDFGESVRNGVILAIEQQNRAGGIHGRPIELIVRDDGQEREQAIRAAEELIALKPEIIIGPVTSSMASIVVPMMNRADQLIISPTVASTDFHGKDDNFFRVNRTTREAAIHHAGVLFERGSRRVGIAFDASNLQYSETWVKAFRDQFEHLGGHVTETSRFESAATPSFAEVIAKLLPSTPDTLLFVASSLDTARLSQQARRQAPGLLITSTEWAASGELLSEMGGESVDGLLIAHAYDRNDSRQPYQSFREAYKQRFQREFGSFSLLAYDTANIVITALQRRQDGESLKQALLRYGPYEGTQQQIVFDANGDTTRQVYFTEIRNGNFEQVR